MDCITHKSAQLIRFDLLQDTIHVLQEIRYLTHENSQEDISIRCTDAVNGNHARSFVCTRTLDGALGLRMPKLICSILLHEVLGKTHCSSTSRETIPNGAM
jgi:hypothetical protein